MTLVYRNYSWDVWILVSGIVVAVMTLMLMVIRALTQKTGNRGP